MPGPGIERVVLLLGSEDPISGISQSRYDVSMLVQMVILGADEDVHVRMFPLQSFDPVRCRNDAHEADIDTASLLEHGNGCRG